MNTLQITRGDNASLMLTILDNLGAPVVLTAAVIKFTAKQSIRHTDAQAIINKTTINGGIVLGDSDGEATISILPSDTAVLTRDTDLVWDVEIIDAGGVVRTPARGHLLVKYDVTRDDG